MKIFEKIVGPSTSEELKAPQVPIYMELISHSYNDKIRQRILTALAVIGSESKIITFLCSTITVSLIDMESNDPSDVVSGISANIETFDNDNTILNMIPVN